MMFTLMKANMEITRTAMEGTSLCGFRTLVGDETAAETLFDMPYDAGFTRRNNNQLGSMWKSYCEAQMDNGGDP